MMFPGQRSTHAAFNQSLQDVQLLAHGIPRPIGSIAEEQTLLKTQEMPIDDAAPHDLAADLRERAA